MQMEYDHDYASPEGISSWNINGILSSERIFNILLIYITFYYITMIICMYVMSTCTLNMF